MKKSCIILCIIVLSVTFLSGCSNSGNSAGDTAYYSSGTSSADLLHPEYATADVLTDESYGLTDPQGNLVVVLSDIHMGDQRAIDEGYGWFRANEPLLAGFLASLAASPAVKEVVIGGDFFDEWVIPMDHDTLNGFGSDQQAESKFVDSVAAANPTIISGIKAIMSAGKKVTYVPGNHDMLVTSDDISRIFPGINQSRDAAGLGTYSPGGLPEVLIEHSHRYDFFNAPDMYSNRIPYSPENYTNNSSAIIPPGFFVSKIAASNNFQTPAIPGSLGATDSLIGPFFYWTAWKLILSQVNPSQDYNAKIIKTGIDGYTGVYSINDLVPQVTLSGIQQPTLYAYIEDNWKNRQTQNQVNSLISVVSGLLVGSLSVWCDLQSNTQYFSRDTSKRIVVFGHTHKATMGSRLNSASQKCIYANSGTWIDKGDPACTFVIIDPDLKIDGSVNETVTVYQYTASQTMKQLYQDSITVRK
jgi:UDP-2,3-diacylglucosamine pyrophosphatase LpxH